MALLPTTDSRRFLPGSWLAFVCKIGERMNVLCEYVYKLSVLFLLVGLWWSFLCDVCYYCLCFISVSRFVMALLPTTDSRPFLPRSWLAFFVLDWWENALCEYVYKLSVLFLLVGLWWSFLCAVCYYCLCFIFLSRFVMALLPTTDSRRFLPRSWLTFVCKIGDRMHYVSMFINCLFYFS